MSHGEEPLSVLWRWWSLCQGLPQGCICKRTCHTASCIFFYTAHFRSIRPKKLVCNSHDAQIGSCIDSSCAIPMARLNAAAFDDPDSLVSLFTLPSIPSCSPTPALIDSGSSHCFIDSSFVARMNIAIQNISLLCLRLVNGSNTNIISCSVEMPVIFLCGTLFTLITPLDPNCPLVLGH